MAQSGTKNTAISFGDFQITVALKKAAHSRDLTTELVDTAGRKVTSGGGPGSRTAPAGCERAVRVSEEHVIRLPQAELEAIENESKDQYATMQVLETIDYRQAPTERITEAYWLQPREGTARGLRLLADALKQTGRVAVVKWVATKRECLGIIRVRHPYGDERVALLLSKLTFANDFALPDEDAMAINDVGELDERTRDAAVRLVKAWARDGEPAIDTASDGAVDARLALLARLQEEAFAKATQQEGELVASKVA